MFKKILAIFVLVPSILFAQTSPNFYYGQVPTSVQWNSYFAAKQDFINPSAANNILTANGTAWYSSPNLNLSGSAAFAGTITATGLTSGTPAYSLCLTSTYLVMVTSGANCFSSSTTATNLAGGAAGEIPWQSAANTTNFTAAGTTNQLLQSNGTSAPTWTSTISGLSSLSSALIVGTGPVASAAAVGPISYGTLTYTDTGITNSEQASLNGYVQHVIQNSNTGSAASADFIVNNGLSTANTYYGDFGINSSGFTGSGAFNSPNATYLTSTTGDLALGTTTANSIHLVTDGSSVDAVTIASNGTSAAGLVTIPNLQYTAPLTNAVAETVSNKLNQSVNVLDFGAINDPTATIDSSTAFINAMAALPQGGTVNFCGWFLLNVAITMPDGIALQGCDLSPGQKVDGGGGGSGAITPTNFPAALVLNPSYGITMGNRTTVSNAVIINQLISPSGTYPLPFLNQTTASSAVAAFNGNAFVPPSSGTVTDQKLENLAVFGFNYVYYDGTSTVLNRPLFRDIKGDDTNGIYVTNVGDIGRAEDVEFWPFTTTAQGFTAATAQRSGTAFFIGYNSTWFKCDDCFSYGYGIGIHVNNASDVRITNSGADNNPAVAQSTIGIQVDGTVGNFTCVDCFTTSQGAEGVLLNSSGNNSITSYTFTRLNAHGNNSANGYINLETGTLYLSDTSFADNSAVGDIQLGSGAQLIADNVSYGNLGSTAPLFGNSTAVANAINKNAHGDGSTSTAIYDSINAYGVTATGGSTVTVGGSGLTVTETGTININNGSSNSSNVNIESGSTNSGNVSIASNSTSNSSNVTIGAHGAAIVLAGTTIKLNSGSSNADTIDLSNGASFSGTVNIATGTSSNTGNVNIGAAGVTNTILGTVSINSDASDSSNVSIGNGSSYSGTLNLAAASTWSGTVNVGTNGTSNTGHINLGASGATTAIIGTVNIDAGATNSSNVGIGSGSTYSGNINIGNNATSNTSTIGIGAHGSTLGLAGTTVGINNAASNADAVNIAAGSTFSGSVNIGNNATSNTGTIGIGAAGAAVNLAGTLGLIGTTSINSDSSDSNATNINAGATPSGTVHIADSATSNTATVNIGNTGSTLALIGTIGINNSASNTATVNIEAAGTNSGTVNVNTSSTSNTGHVNIGASGGTTALLGTININNSATNSSNVSIGANTSYSGTINIGNNATSNTSTISIGNTGATVKMPGLATGTAALDYLCWNSSTGALTGDSSGTCLASLEEYKDNFGYITPEEALHEIMQLKPFWGKYKDSQTGIGDHREQPFLGAHQVESIDPRLAAYDVNGNLHGVRYMELTAVLTAAMQKQQEEIDELKMEVEALKAINQAKQKQIDEENAHSNCVTQGNVLICPASVSSVSRETLTVHSQIIDTYGSVSSPVNSVSNDNSYLIVEHQ